MGWAVLRGTSVASGVCALSVLATMAFAGPHDELIAKHAAAHGLPESLVRRVIQIESRGNPRAVSKGNYGLMQIRLGTARALGYSGTAEGLLDPDTNLTYAVKYLANAYRAAGCNESRAISYYQSGFYKKGGAKCAVSSRALPATSEPVAAADAIALRSAIPPREASQLPTDALRPRVVRVQTIVNKAAAPMEVGTKSDKLPPQTVGQASHPDASWPPSVPPEQSSTSVQELPMPKSRPPNTNQFLNQALAATDTNGSAATQSSSDVATGSDHESKPEPRSSRRHTRRAAKKVDEFGMTSSKQLTRRERASQERAMQDAGPPVPVSY